MLTPGVRVQVPPRAPKRKGQPFGCPFSFFEAGLEPPLYRAPAANQRSVCCGKRTSSGMSEVLASPEPRDMKLARTLPRAPKRKGQPFGCPFSFLEKLDSLNPV